ncbi:MAG: phospholipid carrier-dependent glycosyltransferase [Candidatus Pacebacteria bacterium]|nr:phospholipid carrier-dependent glycosyltransferase [Candidatus Paceibacterota bacterium]MDD5356775.1 phospholipid carrier-dependent glycosyltransferase [Candidatus Paceibacterota bacterium]
MERIENFLSRHGWITLLVLSLVSHFTLFGYPKEVVFDEVHFGKFATDYFTGDFFFDLHPPLAKLLITFFGWIGGYQPGFSFASIGQNFPDSSFLWLRLLPVLAGVLLPIIIYFLCLRLHFSKTASFVAGLLMILENSLLVQSRFILLDSLLLLFGFLGILLSIIAREKKLMWLSFVSGASLACAFSIKWTGLSFLGLVILWELWNGIRNKVSLKGWIIKAVSFCIIPVLLYMAIFEVHFLLLNKSGTGDAFLTTAFQGTLVGSQYAGKEPAPSFLSRFLELNKVMYTANSPSLTHPYGSKWWSWPLMLRPIYYWNHAGDVPGTEAKIYLIGNPVLYWGGLLSVWLLFSSLLLHFRKYKPKLEIIAFLGIGYLVNLLPFMFITRVMFLYHYFTALIFSILIMVFLVDSIENRRLRKTLFIVLVALSLAFFLFFAPLTYGTPLSEHAQNLRFWFPSWR